MIKENKKSSNISAIVKKNGCLFCGTCESICPKKVISHIKTKNNYRFIVDENECLNCGICTKVCPGVGIDYAKYLEKSDKWNNALGNVENCYFSYAKDKDVRFNSASGGSITGLLIFLLENGFIDGAIVCSSPNQSFESRGYIAYTKDEIINAKSSKYVPVPLNLILKEVAQKEEKKFAFVGLPCHIQGLVKFQEVNLVLKRNIFIKIGIVCAKTVNFSGLDWFLKFKNIDRGNIKNIKFRGEGWPGIFSLETKNGQFFKNNFLDYFSLFGIGFFTPTRCLSCVDFLADFSDISFGDAWTKEKLKNDSSGTNICLIRNKFANSLIEKSVNYISLEKIEQQDVLSAFGLNLKLKKGCHKMVKILNSFLGLYNPEYNSMTFFKANFFHKIFYSFVFTFAFLSNKLPEFFMYLPNKFWIFFLKSYSLLVKIISKKN